MVFLREFCETSSVLKVISFVTQLLNIAFIVIPIGLIVMIAVDFGKNVISGKEEDIKKNVIVAIKRVIMTVVIFFVPTIVSIMNGLLNDSDIISLNYNECLENAVSETIAIYEEEEEIEKIMAKKNKQENIVEDIDKSSSYVIGSGLGAANVLPEDEKYYPLAGTDMEGNKLNYFEQDVEGHQLTKTEMEELDQYIKDSIKSVGNDWGLRVAAAGYSLVFGLQEKGLRLHYQKTGRSIDSATNTAIGAGEKCDIYDGFCNNWGLRVTQSERNALKSWGTYYPNIYSGLDCNGFVVWAMANGCGYWSWDMANAMVGNSHYDLTKAKPGDVMTNSGHSTLVVKNNGDGTIIVAESTSWKDNGDLVGLIFTKVTNLSSGGYQITDLSEEYKKNCKLNSWG